MDDEGKGRREQFVLEMQGDGPPGFCTAQSQGPSSLSIPDPHQQILG